MKRKGGCPPKNTRNAAIVAAYRLGTEQPDIALAQGITRARVHTILVREGVTLRPPRGGKATCSPETKRRISIKARAWHAAQRALRAVAA